MWSEGTFAHCWQECKLVKPLWKMAQKFLKRTKTRSTIRYSHPNSGHTFTGTEVRDSCTMLTIHNRRAMESTQVPISGGTDKGKVACVHIGILFTLLGAGPSLHTSS
jgi:hypothetical protein